MRTLRFAALLAVAAICFGVTAALADQVGGVFYGQYFWVVKGHDVAGTGVCQAGVRAYLSPEDWVVGRPAYSGNGGPQAVRRLPGGKRAPLGTTPTERKGRVRVTMAGVEALGAQATFTPSSRLATLSHDGKLMVLVPGSRTALLDGRPIRLSDLPTMHAGRLYVPLTDVATALFGLGAEDAMARISRTAQ